jgi:hypothetical protein
MPATLAEAFAGLSKQCIEPGSITTNEHCGKIFKFTGLDKFLPGCWFTLTGTPSLPPQSSGGSEKKRKVQVEVDPVENADLIRFLNAWHAHWLHVIHDNSMELFESKKPKSPDYLEEIFRHPLNEWVDKHGNTRYSWSLLVHPKTTGVLIHDGPMPKDGGPLPPDTEDIREGDFERFRPHPFDPKTEPPANDLDRSHMYKFRVCVNPMFGYASSVAVGIAMVASSMVRVNPSDSEGNAPQTTEGVANEMGLNIKNIKIHDTANTANTDNTDNTADTDGDTIGARPDGYDGTTGTTGTTGTNGNTDEDGENDTDAFPLTQPADNDNDDADDDADDTQPTKRTKSKRSHSSKPHTKRSRVTPRAIAAH